jgi:hypothetical protein
MRLFHNQDMKRNPLVVALMTAILLVPVVALKLVLPTVCVCSPGRRSDWIGSPYVLPWALGDGG